MSIPSGQGIVPEHLYTYHELARIFQCCRKTVAGWFKNRRKFQPTKNTVRIPGSEVKKFIEEELGRRSGRG